MPMNLEKEDSCSARSAECLDYNDRKWKDCHLEAQSRGITYRRSLAILILWPVIETHAAQYGVPINIIGDYLGNVDYMITKLIDGRISELAE